MGPVAFSARGPGIGGTVFLWGLVLACEDASVSPTAPAPEVPVALQQIRAMDQLVESGQPIPRASCETYTDNSVKKHCLGLAKRPHLWDAKSTAGGRIATDTRSAPGPASTVLDPGNLPSPLSQVQPVDHNCPGEDARDCQRAAALKAVAVRDAEAVAASCNQIESTQWRSDCFFRAGETWAVKNRGRMPEQVLDLCLAAGKYRIDCLDHALSKIGRRIAPMADVADEKAWRKITLLVESWEKAMRRKAIEYPQMPDAFPALYSERFWSYLLHQSYHRAAEPNGAPRRHLSASLDPHIRAALATTMVERDSTNQNLDALLNEAQERFENLTLAEATVGWDPKSHGLVTGSIWFTDHFKDDEIPTTWFLGKSRRPISADPILDLTLSLVSAAAAVTPQRTDLLVEAQNHSNTLVQRTANRLLNQFPVER